jgi:hypothetical protein
MATTDEYHQYARECLQSASKAQSEQERKQFVSMARAWTQAALLEGVPNPTANEEDRASPPSPR